MARLRDEEPVTYQNFSGLRNNVAAGDFDTSDLEVALNVDLNDKGVVSRRKGFGTAVLAGSYHSLWSGAGVCLAVTDTSLKRILPGYTATTLRSNLTAGRRMAYVGVGARAYYSNGVDTGVVENGASRSWGIARPPRISATAISGTLRAGRYQFAMTYVRSDGQESGAPRAGVLELTAFGGFRFSSLPVSTDSGVLTKVLYLSKVNGETLFRKAEIAADETSLDVTDDDVSSLVLRTQHLNAPPAGDVLAVYNGRLLSASGSYLSYSEPYAYELFDPRLVLVFESAVKMIAPVKGGVFVGTDKETVFLQGDDIGNSSLEHKADYGVVPGTLAYAQASAFGEGSQSGLLAVWASTQGACVGADGGAFRNLTQERFAYPKQPQGAALFRQHRGMNQYLTVMQGTETAGNVHA